MRSLVWRYVAAMHRKVEDSAVTEDDINEVKGEISAMRYELMEVFQRNGMDVSSADRKEKSEFNEQLILSSIRFNKFPAAVLAKRMKVWERRLMKDFHVAPVEPPDEEEAVVAEHVEENPLDRFRRISKQVASQSASCKWNEVIKCATIEANSQIGRCRNRESFKNQQNLMKAMDQARKLIEQGPPLSPCHSVNYDVMDQTNRTLVQLLKNISEEISDISPPNTLNVKSHTSRSTTPLNTLNAQLQSIISKSPSPYNTQMKSRAHSPNPEKLIFGPSSGEGTLSPPPKPITQPQISPKLKNDFKVDALLSKHPSIVKGRAATPDSGKYLDDSKSLESFKGENSIPVIEIDSSEVFKPESPKLIDLSNKMETKEDECPLKPIPGSPVKVFKKKSPPPVPKQDISVSRPSAPKIQSNQGMIPPPPEVVKPLIIPSFTKTPATPLLPQKPSNSADNTSETVSPEPQEKEIISHERKVAASAPKTISVEPKAAEPTSAAIVAPLASFSSTEHLMTAEPPRSPSPSCLRPINKIEDVNTIRRQPKTGWL